MSWIYTPWYSREWHRWFAWFPVHDQRRWYWLEMVERRYIGDSIETWYCEYRGVTK